MGAFAAAVLLGGCMKSLPTAPTELQSGITIWEHANFAGASALLTNDELVDGSLGRKWWREVERACEATCGDPEQFNPLVGLAVCGVGYLVAEPFSERRHFVNIRYREGDRVEWLTLGTTWFDHFWLMTDLSQATGLKWLNLPLQRTKLFWSFGDHSYTFDPWEGSGDTQVHAGVYDVVLWEAQATRPAGVGRGVPSRPSAVELSGLTARRRHVGQRAHHDPWRGQRHHRAGRFVELALRQPLCQAEVEHLRPALRCDDSVGALQVAVHDAMGMRVRQRLRDLAAEAQQILGR